MKKSEIIRRKTRKMIAKNLIVLAALATVAFVGVFSWFTKHTTATADGISFATEVTEGLEYFIVPPANGDNYAAINTWISNYNTTHASDDDFVEKEWHTGALTFDYTDAEFKFLEDLFLCETTSDGVSFKLPKLLQFGEIAIVDKSEALTNATANSEYMSFDLYFRSKSRGDVRLLSGSKIEPVNKTNIAGVHDYDTTDSINDETIKPAAIGAVRMSVLNGSTRELLWIPAPCVWFNGVDKHLYTGLTTFTSKGNVTVSNDEIKLTGEGSNEHAYYDDSDNTLSRKVEGSEHGVIASTSGNYQLGSDFPVITLDKHDETNEYYYNHIRINLWIEGEDAESRLKFVGGKFDMKLLFDLDLSSSGS